NRPGVHAQPHLSSILTTHTVGASREGMVTAHRGVTLEVLTGIAAPAAAGYMTPCERAMAYSVSRAARRERLRRWLSWPTCRHRPGRTRAAPPTDADGTPARVFMRRPRFGVSRPEPGPTSTVVIGVPAGPVEPGR
ncbi:hypothetical protein ABZW96_37010, partial [Nocardia sp. NPDC004168]|uniref:hypothetical protein n=1 Tax=Nocardia sp. NPDC004168 TaxID=3154452 RepID=UPI00339FF693